jgi:peptidoglycan/LPS O-acetylase OafA/YrhL
MCSHTWSLAVEEHFYLLLAFCVALAIKKKTASGNDPFQFIPALFVWMACGCLFLRIATALVFPQYGGRLACYATHIRMDSLMCGVMVSYLWHFHCSSSSHALLHRIRYALIAAGVLLLSPAFWYDHHEHRWIYIYGFSMFYLGGACLLVGSLKAFEGRHSPLLRGVTYLGSHSYSVYLWHVMALYWADLLLRKLTSPAQFGLISTPLAFCFMWALGVLAAKVVEFPVLRLRDRLFPSAAKAI